MRLETPRPLEWLNEVYRQLLFLPEQASSHARSIDALHYFEITVMVGVAALIGVAVLWFAWRYRRRPGNEWGARVQPTRRMELGVYGGLLLFFVLLWVVGFRQYLALSRPPEDALEVYVTAKQWMWKFAYPEGAGSVGVLYVPAGRPVRLLLTSRDVIHSFYVPAFRMKRDVVPGRYTGAWFEASEPGRYPILCAELCGVGHSRMSGEVVVLALETWEAWLHERIAADEVGLALARRGRDAALQHGCFQCQSVDGSPSLGPTWRDAFGALVRLQSGGTARVDEAYLTESMMDPTAKLVEGFLAVMPSYQGQLTPPETAAIVEYIKSLRTPPGEREEPLSHGPEAGLEP